MTFIRHIIFGVRSTTKISISVALVSSVLFVSAGAQGPHETGYPDPRFPKFLVFPSEEQMLDAARMAVRQTQGRAPLGLLGPGDTVHVFLNYSQDMEVWNAIKEAWDERGVDAFPVMGWELAGMTPEQYRTKAKENLITGDQGWKEFGVFEPAYADFFPPDVRKQFGDPMTATVDMGGLEFPPQTGKLKDYLDDHPEVNKFFAYPGGRPFVRAAAGPAHAGKFVGNWIYINKIDLMSKVGAFPPDVWKMIDEQIVRPIPHVAEGRFRDPEGTDLHWVLTPEQSGLWEQTSGLTSYSPGHLNVYPPPAQAKWKRGKIRAAANHTAFFPTMTVQINEHGRVVEIKDGGKAGELFRMLLDHPMLKNADFPGAPEEGYWYLTQDGLGTNPKSVRNMPKLVQGTTELANLSERDRAGIQHFSFSHPVNVNNEAGVAYAKEIGVPLSHTSHMHVYFPTVQWKLRDTGEWINVVQKGRLSVFSNPELRALAARYALPENVFAYDWIPAIPGINLEGDYEKDYAEDPWAHIASMWNKIKNGSYQYYIEAYSLSGNSSD